MEKRNSQLEHGQPMEQTRGSLSIITPVSLLANEFNVRSILHGASDLGSCQSNVCNISCGYEQL